MERESPYYERFFRKSHKLDHGGDIEEPAPLVVQRAPESFDSTGEYLDFYDRTEDD